MKPPPDGEGSSDSVALLNKSLYGLKQASRSWNGLLVSKLRDFGLRQRQADPCIFQLQDDDENAKITMIIHHDDMLIAGKENCDDLSEYFNN